MSAVLIHLTGDGKPILRMILERWDVRKGWVMVHSWDALSRSAPEAWAEEIEALEAKGEIVRLTQRDLRLDLQGAAP